MAGTVWVKYEGEVAEVTVPEGGTFKRGVPTEVAGVVAERLLSTPDFKEVPKPKKGEAE